MQHIFIPAFSATLGTTLAAQTLDTTPQLSTLLDFGVVGLMAIFAIWLWYQERKERKVVEREIRDLLLRISGMERDELQHLKPRDSQTTEKATS